MCTYYKQIDIQTHQINNYINNRASHFIYNNELQSPTQNKPSNLHLINAQTPPPTPMRVQFCGIPRPYRTMAPPCSPRGTQTSHHTSTTYFSTSDPGEARCRTTEATAHTHTYFPTPSKATTPPTSGYPRSNQHP